MEPPSQPSETGSAEEWSSVEALLGLILPSDYKAYITTYGTGLVG